MRKRLIEFHMMKGGWPPSIIQAIVSGVKRIRVHSVKAIDISGGEWYPYSWRLNESQIDDLRAQAKRVAYR